MSYTVHNFTAGDIIHATDLNEMDAQIAANAEGSAVNIDDTLTIAGAAADAKAVGDEITDLKADLNKIQTATSEDVGKVLKAKMVESGKVTEWEFGETGVTVDPTLSIAGKAADAKASGDAIGDMQTTLKQKADVTLDSINGLNLANNGIAYISGSNYITYYFQCEKGKDYAFHVANDSKNDTYVRFGIATQTPANGVNAVFIYELKVESKTEKEFAYTPSDNGYISMSYYTPSSVNTISVSEIYAGLVFEMRRLQEDVDTFTTFSLSDASVYRVKANSAVEATDGTFLRCVLYVSDNFKFRIVAPNPPGCSVALYNSEETAIKFGSTGRIVLFTSKATYKEIVGSNTIGGYLSVSLTKPDGSAITDDDKDELLSALSYIVYHADNNLLDMEESRKASTSVFDSIDKMQKEIINIYNNGVPSLKAFGEFDHYGLDANGDLMATQRYRVSNRNPIVLENDLTISVSNSFRFGYCSFLNGVSTWNGWFTATATIPAGTVFKLQIARRSEITSEIADVEEFISALSIDSWLDKHLPYVGKEDEYHFYSGDMKPRKYLLSEIKLPGTTFSGVQGMAITGDIMAVLFNKGSMTLYNLETLTKISEYNLASYNDDNHANSASFSKTMGTKYPLLYISECYGQHRCFVEDINDTSSSLIQTISYANDNNDYDTQAWDWTLDNYSGRIMTLGVKNNKKLIKVFPLPSISNSTVTLTDSEKIDEWYADDSAGETLNTYQGNAVIGNTLYLPISSTERLFAFDKISHIMTGKLNIQEDYPNIGELEDISLYKDDLIIATHAKKYFEILFM